MTDPCGWASAGACCAILRPCPRHILIRSWHPNARSPRGCARPRKGIAYKKISVCAETGVRSRTRSAPLEASAAPAGAAPRVYSIQAQGQRPASKSRKGPEVLKAGNPCTYSQHRLHRPQLCHSAPPLAPPLRPGMQDASHAGQPEPLTVVAAPLVCVHSD